jgi:threonine dehydratase
MREKGGVSILNEISAIFCLPGGIRRAHVEPSLSDILKAKECFEGIIDPSPLVRSSYLSGLIGAEILLKMENLQETGSFKVRGAYNRLLHLDPEEKRKGVVAASAGNHAQGVAWAASRLSIEATIVMPEDVSLRKLLAVKEYGAQVLLIGKRYDEAYSRALEISRESGKILIPGFDDLHVIAGQGTIGLELSEVLHNDVAILVPVGGGGLISGIAIAAKSINPSVRVIGIQAAACPSTIHSLEKAQPVSIEVLPTIADGIAINRPGSLNFPIIQKYVDEVVCVEEEGIAGAILSLLDKVSIVAEGAGATPLAALVDGKVCASSRRYVLIISGGNIETNTIDRILQRGAVKMGRLIRIEAKLLDVPGSLWKLLGIVSEEKANILHIFHNRLDIHNPMQISRVQLSLETRGHDHAGEIVGKLKDAGYDVRKIF